MSHVSLERRGALAGIAFGILTLVLGTYLEAAAGHVSPPASAEEIVRHYSDAGTRTAYDIFVLGTLLVAPLFLWFLGTLRSALARAGTDHGRSASIVYGAGLTFLVLSLAAQAVDGSATVTIGNWRDSGGQLAVDAGSLAVLATLGFGLEALAYGLTAAMILAVALAIRRTGFLPRWLWPVGIGLAVLAIPASVAGIGLFVLLGWLIPVCVALYQRAGRTTDATPADAPPIMSR